MLSAVESHDAPVPFSSAAAAEHPSLGQRLQELNAQITAALDRYARVEFVDTDLEAAERCLTHHKARLDALIEERRALLGEAPPPR
jgi:hypothetical protein